jgi:hypothetical protein
VPLNWALTQDNLGGALEALGERESGTERLEEAGAAFREALTVYTLDASPYEHDKAQRNIDRLTALIVQRQGK